ncbi:MAG: T9SS type B sorting domain-containing protein [Weeksellaceae bacterium]|nr:T9SS type B sorting domain-containing protein [Weeksellaceae bacterium]
MSVNFNFLKIFFVILMVSFAANLNAQTGENQTCDNAAPACPDQDFGVNIPSIVGTAAAEQGPAYGCLGSQPRPLWYYLQISQTGQVEFILSQTTQPDGQGSPIDVDYIIWGPFDSAFGNCDALTADKIIDCSYHPSFTEYVDFDLSTAGPNPGPNPGTAQAGEWYILMITNFSGQPGYINMQPTDRMTANFDCSILGDTFYYCDVEGDGQEIIDLNSQYFIEQVSIDYPNDIVTFHYTQQEARDGVNAIFEPITLQSEPITVYARLENLIEGTITVVVVTFELIDIPEMENIQLQACDNDGNELELWDLTVYPALGAPNVTEGTFSYYLSFEDAETETNPIENPDYFEHGAGTIWVRANVGDCFEIAEIELVLIDTVELQPVSVSVCDDDEDGEMTFNLSQFVNEILSGNQGVIRFYENEADAVALNDLYIQDPANYTTASTVLYAALVSDSGCTAVTTVTLNVVETPEVNDVVEPYTLCDIGMDGEEVVDLTIALQDILGGTTTFNYEFYTSQADAEAGNSANAIANPEAYTLTNAPQTFYLRVFADGECYSVASFTFDLLEGPEMTGGSVLACEINGTGTFDLTTVNVGSDQLTLSYHWSEAGAHNNTDVIEDPSAFTVNAPSTVYVRGQLGTDCYSIVEITLDYYDNPVLNLETNYAICEGYPREIDAGAGFASYLWSSGETTQTIVIDQIGTYWVEVTNEQGCVTREEFNVVLGESPVITGIESGPDFLIINATGGEQPYEYSLNGMIWSPSNQFNYLAPGTYQIYVRSATGCVSEVMEISIFTTPTLFTPNGDGINDTFRLPELSGAPNSEVRIFDRYGKMIYNGVTVGNEVWDGIDNRGHKVPTEDYWYIIDLSDGRKLTGHVTVKNRTEKGR